MTLFFIIEVTICLLVMGHDVYALNGTNTTEAPIEILIIPNNSFTTTHSVTSQSRFGQVKAYIASNPTFILYSFVAISVLCVTVVLILIIRTIRYSCNIFLFNSKPFYILD